MSTTRETITRALVACQVLGAGRTPKAQDALDGLATLQELVDHLEGYGAAHPWLNDWVSAARTVSRNEASLKLHCRTSAGGFVVTLPANPRDGARFAVLDTDASFATSNLSIDSAGNLFDAVLDTAGEPTGGSRSVTTLNSNGLRRSWMFRADLGAWIRTSELTLNSAMPYPSEFDRSFRYMLAVELAGDYGVEPPAQVFIHAQHGYARLAARYVQPLPMTIDRALMGARSPSLTDLEQAQADTIIDIGWD